MIEKYSRKMLKAPSILVSGKTEMMMNATKKFPLKKRENLPHRRQSHFYNPNMASSKVSKKVSLKVEGHMLKRFFCSRIKVRLQTSWRQKGCESLMCQNP